MSASESSLLTLYVKRKVAHRQLLPKWTGEEIVGTRARIAIRFERENTQPYKQVTQVVIPKGMDLAVYFRRLQLSLYLGLAVRRLDAIAVHWTLSPYESDIRLGSTWLIRDGFFVDELDENLKLKVS